MPYDSSVAANAAMLTLVVVLAGALAGTACVLGAGWLVRRFTPLKNPTVVAVTVSVAWWFFWVVAVPIWVEDNLNQSPNARWRTMWSGGLVVGVIVARFVFAAQDAKSARARATS